MELNRKRLEKFLSLACQIVEKKPPQPILGCVRLTADDKGVRAVATNLNLDVAATLETGPGDAMDICIDANRLATIVRTLDCEDVTIAERKEGRAEVTGDQSKFDVGCSPGRDFPKTETDVVHMVEVKEPAIIAEMLGQALESASNDITRAHLACVCLRSHKGVVRMLATNGHTGMVTERSIEFPDIAGDAMISRASAEVIRKVLAEAKEPVQFAQKGRMVRLAIGDTSIVVRLSEPTFPPLEQVMKIDPRYVLELAKGALLTSVKRVATVTNTAVGDGIAMEIGKDAIKLAAADSGSGDSAEDSVPVVATTCPPGKCTWKIGVSAKYLMGCASVMSGDTLTMQIANELDPIIISDGKGCVAAVMPVRL